MARYKNPLVAKEIYLTLDSREFGSGTIVNIDDYKREYGVDLRTIFKWEKDGDIPALSSPTKLYGVVKEDTAYSNFVFPATIDLKANIATIFMMIPSATTDSNYAKNQDEGIVVNFLTGDVSIFEI